MNESHHEVLRLLGRKRRLLQELRQELDEVEQGLDALDADAQKQAYSPFPFGLLERAFHGLLQLLVERPIRQLVDRFFDWLDRRFRRKRRQSVGF